MRLLPLFALGLVVAFASPVWAQQAQQPNVDINTVPCTGGTGSVIATVTTTPEIVCSAVTGQGVREFAAVIANSSSGTEVAVGTYDGTTPSPTHYEFELYGSGTDWDTKELGFVPTGPIQVVSLGGTVAITATADQTNQP